jgi:acyl carrier protein phosphodiesterase
MLEARKLSDQLQQDQSAKFWSWLTLAVWMLTLALMASVWIGLEFEKPPADQSQQKMALAHTQVMNTVGLLKESVSPEQEISAAFFDQVASLNAPLLDYAQMAAVGLRIPADTKDAQSWPGQINLWIDDLKTVSNSKEALLNYVTLREALIAVYKVKGSFGQKQLSQSAPASGFYMALEQWIKATSAEPPTTTPTSKPIPFLSAQLSGAVLAKGQASSREVGIQMDTLEVDPKHADHPVRAKVAKDLVALLSKNDLMPKIRKADDAWTQFLLAQERLRTATSQLLPVPQVVIDQPAWHVSSLAFPGTSSQGLMASFCAMIFVLAVMLAGHFARRRHLRLMSQQWLMVTQQLESAVRSVDAPLANALSRMDVLSTEFVSVTDKLKQMQLAFMTPVDAPPQTLDEQAWDVATRMQRELESDLNLLREKLLNIHLQFCSGQTYENLVYDLAFTTEAIQTVFTTARDLGRSVALLKESLTQAEALGDGQEFEALITQLNGLRASSKKITLSLQDLSSRLQLAVEDVPEGRRFEVSARNDEVGRPSVNQSI